jgi:luciferase family oxidoreductase group 1
MPPTRFHPQDVVELQAYFRRPEPEQAVQAVPGAGLPVPLWLLGSSLFSAQLAATLGLPFAFASHFAPDHLDEALATYRSDFRPSAELEQPYAMACVGAFLAESEAQAKRLFTSWQQSFVNLRRGTPGLLPPPVEHIDWTPAEEAMVSHAFREAVVGSPTTAQRRIAALLERTRVDEVMFTSAIFDQTARLRSFELLAQVRTKVTAPAKS